MIETNKFYERGVKWKDQKKGGVIYMSKSTLDVVKQRKINEIDAKIREYESSCCKLCDDVEGYSKACMSMGCHAYGRLFHLKEKREREKIKE